MGLSANRPRVLPLRTTLSAAYRAVRCSAALAVDFRCTNCGESAGSRVHRLVSWISARSGKLKTLWRERRTSNQPLDASGVWRFRDVLPELDDWSSAITLREGNTPVYDLPRCARSAGVDRLRAKHQGMNPTGSFKDTGMTVAISFARQNKFHWVACASTGNTSASMAAYAARGGMRSLVVIPDGKIAWGKLSQSLDYGALTCQLRTDFDGCVRVLNEIIRRYPIYLLNSVNPYRLEGQKTAAIELLEQLDWQVPDHVIVPGGNLGNNSALGKAFLEMKRLGVVQIGSEDFRDPGRRRQSALSDRPRETRQGTCGSRSRHAGDRDSHWQSCIVEEVAASPRGDRRLRRAGERSGNRGGQS